MQDFEMESAEFRRTTNMDLTRELWYTKLLLGSIDRTVSPPISTKKAKRADWSACSTTRKTKNKPAIRPRSQRSQLTAARHPPQHQHNMAGNKATHRAASSTLPPTASSLRLNNTAISTHRAYSQDTVRLRHRVSPTNTPRLHSSRMVSMDRSRRPGMGRLRHIMGAVNHSHRIQEEGQGRYTRHRRRPLRILIISVSKDECGEAEGIGHVRDADSRALATLGSNGGLLPFFGNVRS